MGFKRHGWLHLKYLSDMFEGCCVYKSKENVPDLISFAVSLNQRSSPAAGCWCVVSGEA